jgi:hypothetical protein
MICFPGETIMPASGDKKKYGSGRLRSGVEELAKQPSRDLQRLLISVGSRAPAAKKYLAVAVCAALVLLISVASPQADTVGQLLYTAGSVPLYAAAADHAAAATITPGTALQADGSAASGMQAVTIEAWTQDGADSTLFAAAGRRIVLARLKDGAAKPPVLATMTDPYGNVWHQVRLMGFAPTADLVPDQESVWVKARALYSKRCSACHALHHTNEFTANQWPTILKTMTRNAALQPDQAALITQYLQTHAKQ